MEPKEKASGGGRRTLFDEMRPLDARPDGFVVAQPRVGAESLVQPGAEVVVAEGVLAAEEEEF